ncbi:MAG TPA: STAS domain-containing protein [Dehalococcoidia bacterium]|jgi:rsbT antagonist protein RsbS|nr:STAS domain-containing protein [Dehalococcoidia bacterium]
MEEQAAAERVSMYVTRGCLVVPIQVELSDELALRVQQDVLHRVCRGGVSGVVIDVSGVMVIDSVLARIIFDTAKMATLLGTRAVVSGLGPGVAASLTDLDFDPEDVPTAISLEEGLRMLEGAVSEEEEEGCQ